jgi:hypothetical protein
MLRLEPALDLAPSEYLPHMHWHGKALERLSAEIAIFEQRPDQPMRLGRDDHCVRVGERLQARCEVGCLTDRRILLGYPFPNKITHHQHTGCDTDACLQLNAAGEMQCANDIENGKPAPHRSFGIILMRSGISKIREHPVTEILRNHAVQALDLIGAAALEGTDDIALLFGIEAR